MAAPVCSEAPADTTFLFLQETGTEMELWAKDSANAMNSYVSLDRKEVFSHVEQAPLNLAAEGADQHCTDR